MGMDRTTIDDAKAPSLTVQLPRGYLLETDDGTFILGTATIREMTGEEEDVLANEKVSFAKRMQQLVGGCLTCLEDDQGHSITDKKMLLNIPANLLMADIVVLILRIREVTVGSEVRQKITCPECTTDEGNKFSWTAILDLSEFKTLPAEGDLFKQVREFTTSRGNRITWEMMTGAMQLQYDKVNNPKQRATAALMSRVRTLNDEPATKESLKALPAKERQEIRDCFDVEGGIETDIDCVCSNCGHEFKKELEIGGAGFFSPSETSKS